jgi:hypothetical protein
MWPFRRRREETLNEILLREAGLDESEEEPTPAEAPAGREDRAIAPPGPDVLVTVDAPAIRGDEVEFAALPDGDLIVDSEEGDDDLRPLAEAVERELPPPYRALGRRQEGDLWAVTADPIVVLRFTYDPADRLELVSRDGETQLTADDEPVAGTVPELEQAGRAEAPDYAVHAERLDGDLWEVRAAAL